MKFKGLAWVAYSTILLKIHVQQRYWWLFKMKSSPEDYIIIMWSRKSHNLPPHTLNVNVMADLTLTRTGGPWKITTVHWTRSTDPMDGIVNAICCIEISVPHWWDSRCHECRILGTYYELPFSLRERELASGEICSKMRHNFVKQMW